MATRMLQRRGTASQWNSANPVLGEGEIGWESDTNKFKIGDGVNNWASLSYFLDEDSIGGSLDGYATEAYVDTAVSNLVDSAPATLDTLNELAAALGDDANFATTITNAIAGKQDAVSGVSSTEIGYLDGVTSSIQTQINSKANTSHTHAISDVTNLSTTLNGKANLSGAQFTGNVISDGAFFGVPQQEPAVSKTASNLGYRGIPRLILDTTDQTLSGTWVSGSLVYTAASRTVTIPANSSVAFEIGTTIVFISGPGATTTIAINSDTMYLAGSGATGSRTLAAHGMATAVKVASTTWYISGNGLS